MALPPGTTLGWYDIVTLVGVGGMGEVYEGRHSTLGQRVALKVLPESVAFDVERIARFEREAKLLASVSHPNIAALYGFEACAGRHFLVMEFVEGDDLAARTVRGPMGVDEGLAIARQIADALDAAHERGIVHRDLKPANVKITPDGVVKVLDFGLAKETSPAGAQSEVVTALGQTQLGVMVGTAAYMAPEQAQGKAVDKRADIWAFGVVLYEMLTGISPFASDSLAGTLASVLTREVDLEPLPPAVRPIVAQCLKRNPKNRLRDIGDATLLLDAVAAPTQPSSGRRRERLAWTGALLLLGAAVTSLAMWRRSPGADAPVRRFVLDVAVSNPGSGFALSPDGERLAYPARGDAERRLWIQEFNQTDARPVAGTEDGKRPFFSPDGQWFAFFTGQARLGHLKKAPVGGNAFNTRGSATPLCDNANLYGGTWSSRDDIIFSGPGGLMHVSASGGPCEAISRVDPTEGDHRWPQMLPDGKHVLFTIGREGAFDSARLAVLDLATHRYRTVLEGAAHGEYLPTGHLVFVRSGQMFAIRFDPDRLTPSGSPRVMVDPIFHVNTGGFAAYSFDASGTLIYSTPRIDGFAWRDRHGETNAVAGPSGLFRYFALSPDGTRVALQQSGRGDIEILQLDRGTSQPLTSEGMNHTPIWTPNGRAVTFSTLGKGIVQRSVDGRSGELQLIETPDGDLAPWEWTRDGTTLLYERGDPLNIWTLTLAANGAIGERRLLLGGANVAYQHPALSPDGRWIAYASTESGSRQINVRAFPGLDGRVAVSTRGGEHPRWTRDGKELLYLSPDDQIMVADVESTRAGFAASAPRVLLASAGAFDVDPTGQRFLVVIQKQPEQLQLVTNWFADIRRRMTEADAK
jgi:serine/threonine-protein kinase